LPPPGNANNHLLSEADALDRELVIYTAAPVPRAGKPLASLRPGVAENIGG
jgi:hypothetical protein